MSGAHVDSFDVVRDFRAAVATFANEARDALAIYDLELRRTMDWLLDLQPEAWKQEIRRSEDAIQNAKLDLTRCRMQRLPDGNEPACMEEKKALQKAKNRLEFSQEKLAATKRWGQAFNRESIQYISQATQLGDLFDSDLPRALAMLDRALLALEAYAELKSDRPSLGPAPASRPADPVAGNSQGVATESAPESASAAPSAADSAAEEQPPAPGAANVEPAQPEEVE